MVILVSCLSVRRCHACCRGRVHIAKCSIERILRCQPPCNGALIVCRPVALCVKGVEHSLQSRHYCRDRPVPIPSPGIQLVNLSHVEDLAEMMAAVPGNGAAIKQHFNLASDRAITFDGGRPEWSHNFTGAGCTMPLQNTIPRMFRDIHDQMPFQFRQASCGQSARRWARSPRSCTSIQRISTRRPSPSGLYARTCCGGRNTFNVMLNRAVSCCELVQLSAWPAAIT